MPRINRPPIDFTIRPLYKTSKPKRKKTETQLSAKIQKYASSLGAVVDRQNSGAVKFEDNYVRLGKSGSPDTHILLNGHSIYMEIKKSQKEADAWIRVVERYKKTGVKFPSHKTIYAQYERMKKIKSQRGFPYLIGDFDQAVDILNFFANRVNHVTLPTITLQSFLSEE